MIPALGTSKYVWKDTIVLERDALTEDTLSQFFGQLSRISPLKRPKVFFRSDGPTSESLRMFENFQDIVSLYRAMPSSLILTEFERTDDNTRQDYAKYFIAGSMESAASQKLEKPALDDSPETKKKFVIDCHAKVSALQRLSGSFSDEASELSHHLLSFVKQQRALHPEQDTQFFKCAQTYILLDQVVIEDDAKDAAAEALAFTNEIEDPVLNAVALRYSNQLAGVSAYSLELLGRASEIIKKQLRTDRTGVMLEMQHHAIQQNIFISRLFSKQRRAVDAEEALSYANYVDETIPSYYELAMLKNSAALSFMLTGKTARASEIWDQCIYDNGYAVDILNFRVNRLIAQHVSTSSVDEKEVTRIFKGFKALKFPQQSGYHPTMALGNLLQITTDPSTRKRISNYLLDKRFMPYSAEVVKERRLIEFLRNCGFLFMEEQSFRGAMGQFIDDYGLMPAFEFNWSTPPFGENLG